MTSFIIRRLLQTAATVLGATLVVFFSLYLAGGDPAEIIAGETATLAQIERIRAYYGFDRPLYEQYWRWISGVVVGNFGTSIRGGWPIFPHLVDAFRISLQLAVGALALAILVGVPLGIVAALRRDSYVDLVVMTGAVLGMSMPGFWIALMLILVFAVQLGWLPSSGWGSWERAVLPIITLSSTATSLFARMTRAVMIEAMLEDYIRTARSKGLPQRLVVYKHALRNVLAPIVTLVGIWFGLLASGAVITESVFAIPGGGRMILSAVYGRDFPVVQGGILIVATFVVGISTVVDLTYALLDPRVRYD